MCGGIATAVEVVGMRRCEGKSLYLEFDKFCRPTNLVTRDSRLTMPKARSLTQARTACSLAAFVMLLHSCVCRMSKSTVKLCVNIFSHALHDVCD